ncbi:hypothetical protein ACEPPN_003506 [Leptodophora sp. 'Broadleaf-Isolate-01']
MAKSTPQIKHGGSKRGKKKTSLDTSITRIQKKPKYKTPAYISQEARIQAALEAYENPDDTDITSLRIAAGVFSRGSQSLVLNNEDSAKRVKPRGGGRVISSKEGLRIIGEKNEAAQESKLTKLRREANITGNVLKLEEEKVTRALARQQKKEEKETAKVQKRMEKARIREEKAQAKIQQRLDKAAKIQALISAGKKPRGRKPNTIKEEEATQQEEAIQQEPVVMAASQRPIRTKRLTQKAIEILSDDEQEGSSNIESLVESDLSANSDSDVNLTDNSSGGPVDYNDYD